jgi:hypothetical protein
MLRSPEIIFAVAHPPPPMIEDVDVIGWLREKSVVV